MSKIPQTTYGSKADLREIKPAFWLWLLVIGAASMLWHHHLLIQSEIRDMYFLEEVVRLFHSGGLPCFGRELASTGFHTGSLEHVVLLLVLRAGLGLTGLLWFLSALWSLGVMATMIAVRRVAGLVSAVIAGLALADAEPFLRFLLRFQNNALLPSFMAFALIFILPALASRKIRALEMAALGLACGAATQIHPVAGLFFIITLIFWIFRRVRAGLPGWLLFFAFALLPWIPFLICEVKGGFENFLLIFQSGLRDTNQEPETLLKRLLSWTWVIDSPEGLLCFTATGGALVVYAIKRQFALRQSSCLIIVFCLANIIIPLIIYDFTRRGLFLLYFEPMVAIWIAQTPELSATIASGLGASEKSARKFKKASYIFLAAVILAFPVSRFFPPRGEMTNANAIKLRMAIAEKAQSLGVPFQADWEDRFHGPFQLPENESWEFIKTLHVTAYADQSDNDVLIFPDSIKSAPCPDLTLFDHCVSSIPRLLNDLKMRKSSEDDLLIEAWIKPSARHLYMQYGAKRRYGPFSDPLFAIDGMKTPFSVIDNSDDVEKIILYHLTLPDSGDARALTIRWPHGERATTMRRLDLYASDRPISLPPKNHDILDSPESLLEHLGGYHRRR